MTASMLQGLAAVLEVILNMVQLLVFASIIVSWVGADPGNPIVRAIYATTEPLYAPFRKLTKNIPGPFDWAPFCILLIIVFMQRGILPYLKILIVQQMGGFTG